MGQVCCCVSGMPPVHWAGRPELLKFSLPGAFQNILRMQITFEVAIQAAQGCLKTSSYGRNLENLILFRASLRGSCPLWRLPSRWLLRLFPQKGNNPRYVVESSLPQGVVDVFGLSCFMLNHMIFELYSKYTQFVLM